MLANRVREFSTTLGTGDITLGGAMAGHIRFGDAFAPGDAVIYVIEDGDNYEIGTGTCGAGDILARTSVSETLESGVLTRAGATAITLSGQARIYCAATAEFLLNPTEAADIINEVTPGAGVTVDGVLLKDGGGTFSDKINQTSIEAIVELNATAIGGQQWNVISGGGLNAVAGRLVFEQGGNDVIQIYDGLAANTLLLDTAGLTVNSNGIFSGNVGVAERSDGIGSLLAVGKQASNNGGTSTLQFYAHNGMFGNGFKAEYVKDAVYDELRFEGGSETTLLALDNISGAATFSGNLNVGGGNSILSDDYANLAIGDFAGGNNGLTIQTPNTGRGGVAFSDGNTTSVASRQGRFDFDHLTDTFEWLTADSVRMALNGTLLDVKTAMQADQLFTLAGTGTRGVELSANGFGTFTGAPILDGGIEFTNQFGHTGSFGITNANRLEAYLAGTKLLGMDTALFDVKTAIAVAGDVSIVKTSGNSIFTIQSGEGNWSQVFFQGDGTGTEYVIGRNDVGNLDAFVIGRSGGNNDFILNSVGNATFAGEVALAHSSPTFRMNDTDVGTNAHILGNDGIIGLDAHVGKWVRALIGGVEYNRQSDTLFDVKTAMDVTSNFNVASTIRATDIAGVPSSGKGVELRYNPVEDWGGVIAIDRDLAQFKDLRLEGSLVDLRVSGTSVVEATGSLFDVKTAMNVSGNLSAALTGTVSVTINTNTVTGLGTLFTAELSVGDPIKIGAEIFTVSGITNNTSLTLDTNHLTGASAVTAYTDPDLMSVINGDGVTAFNLTPKGDATFAGALSVASMVLDNTTLLRDVNTGVMTVGGGNASSTGGNIRYWGGTSSKPGLVEIRDGTTVSATFDGADATFSGAIECSFNELTATQSTFKYSGALDNTVISTPQSYVIQLNNTGLNAGRSFSVRNGGLGYADGVELFKVSETAAIFSGDVSHKARTSIGALGVTGQYAVTYNPDTAGQSVWHTQVDAGSFSWRSGSDPYSGYAEHMTLSTSGNLWVAGNVDSAGRIKHAASTGEDAWLDLTARTADGLAYRNTEIRSLTGASGNGATLAFYTDDAAGALQEALRLDASQNATFSGDVTLDKATGASTLLIQNTGIGGDASLQLRANNATPGNTFINFGDIGSAGAGQMLYTHSDDKFTFKTNAIVALTLDANQNATFAGQIIAQATGTASAVLSLDNNGTSGRQYDVGSASTGYGNAGAFYIYDVTAAAERFRIDSTGDATFAGDLDVHNLKVDNNGLGAISATGSIVYGGGTNAGTYGANILMYAESNAIAAYDMSLRAGSTPWLYWDNSISTATFSGDVIVGSGSLATTSAASTVVLDSVGANYLSFANSATTEGGLLFADPSNATAGWMVYNHSTDTLRLGVAGADALVATTSLFDVKTAMAVGGDLSVSGTTNYGPIASLTVTANAITPISYFSDVDTSLAAQTVKTISGGTEGDKITISPSSSNFSLTVQDMGVGGNIQIGGDFIMNSPADTLTLYFDGTNWREISRADNA